MDAFPFFSTFPRPQGEFIFHDVMCHDSDDLVTLVIGGSLPTAHGAGPLSPLVMLLLERDRVVQQEFVSVTKKILMGAGDNFGIHFAGFVSV